MGWLDSITSAAGDYLKNNAGQIASGVAGAVLGNKGGKDTKTGTTVETMPSWMTEYAQQLLQQSAALAGQPYQPYTGPRVAGLNQDQQDAANLVRSNVGQASGVIANAMGQLDPNAGQGMLAKAGQYLDNAGGSWLDNSGKFMDDYQANVTNPAVAQAMRAWNEQINPGIQSDFSGSKGVGAFGSDAMLRTLAKQGSNLTEQLGENMASYLDKGYNAGMGQFNTENSQKGQLSQIAAQLAGQTQNMNQSGAKTMADLAKDWSDQSATEAQALSNVGEQQRQIDQAGMDVDFQNWARAQGWSQEQLQNMLNTLGGVQGSAGRTTSTTGTSSTSDSPLKNAAAGVALYNSIFGNGNTGVVGPKDTEEKARGGMLRRIAARRAA